MQEISYFLFRNTELLNILILCVIAVLLSILIAKFIPFKEKETKENTVSTHLSFLKPSRDSVPFTRKDFKWVLILTSVYAVISLYALGNTTMPTTTWQPSYEDQTIIFQLDEDTDFDAVYAIFCEGDNNSNLESYQYGMADITLSGSNDLENWEEIVTYEKGSIYAYEITEGNWNYKYIKLECPNKNDSLTEIGFKKTDEDTLLKVSIYEDEESDGKYPATLLIDEQDEIILHPTYLDESYFDEIYHPRNANEIANGEYMYASVHPLLGTSIIALSIKLFGNNPLAWRLPGALFGIMMVPLFYFMIKLLFKKRRSAILGTILLDAEFMHLTTSRIATLEPFSVFFILLMFYFMIRYIYTHFYDTSLKKRFTLLACSGISMGLGFATKWTACYSAVGLAILFFLHLFDECKLYKKIKGLDLSEYNEEVQKERKKICKTFVEETWLTILWCLLVFIVVPVVIYFVSYIPTKVWRNGFSIKNVISQIEYMYRYHINLTATHPYQSSWWQWILDIRPIWYYYGTDVAGYKHSISCFTNPIITWVGLLTTLYTFYSAIRNRSKIAIIISVGYLTAFLPWVSLVQRCVFAYHFYPTSFFMLLSIVYASEKLITRNKKSMYFIIGFVVISCIIFIMFLPVTAGQGTSVDYIHFLEWFSTWYFG